MQVQGWTFTLRHSATNCRSTLKERKSPGWSFTELPPSEAGAAALHLTSQKAC